MDLIPLSGVLISEPNTVSSHLRTALIGGIVGIIRQPTNILLSTRLNAVSLKKLKDRSWVRLEFEV